MAKSWLRSSTARVNQDIDPPITLLDADLITYRSGGLWLPRARDAAHLRALGRGEGVLRLEGRDLLLNRRHTEIRK